MNYTVLKKQFCLIVGLVVGILWRGMAQGEGAKIIEVAFNKTTTVVFAKAVASVDRGSRDFLVQKARGVNNVLQLKAARMNFEETNLTVITTDGQLHHFFIRYAGHPDAYTVVADLSQDVDHAPIQFAEAVTTSALGATAEKILHQGNTKTVKKESRLQMRLSVEGIYVQGDVMFYHLKIDNRSNIPFITDMLQFSVIDRRKVNRTAFQQVAKHPLFELGTLGRVEGKESMEMVFAFPAFTFPSAKILKIDLLERNGGRNLSLRLKNNTIVKASRL